MPARPRKKPKTVTSTQLRSSFRKYANSAERGQMWIVTRDNKPSLALLSVSQLTKLLDQVEDRHDVRNSRERNGEDVVPWSEVKERLGLDPDR